MPEPIKLIIWDLDDTFWRGTLSEGAVEAVEENLALVRDTAARGLVHTVVSKNDLAPVEAKLTELGIRDLFVFLRVSWQPKGAIIKQLLEDMQLRAPNALFLDDNPVNRAEALYYNPTLQVADPVDLPHLAPQLRAAGKPDPTFSRLEQYKLLERQQQARATYHDNLAFLRDAQVQIEFREGVAVLPDLDRIEELINRSNQLNFTKQRVTKDELRASFQSPTTRWGTVRVRDQFGDYGLVGVYAVEQIDNAGRDALQAPAVASANEGNRLIQFVFSCRILHLGIEQFTYAHLGFPRLEVQGEVATELTQTDRPDWITIVTPMSEQPTPAAPDSAKRLRVLLKGGCDLGQLTPFLQAFQLEVVEEFNYVNENQVPVHVEHLELLRQGSKLSASERQRLARLPFLGAEAFDTKLWQGDYDVLVYSPLMDYTQELYREKSTGIAVPFGGYYNLTTQDPAAQAAKHARRKFRGMDEAFLRRFQQEFTCVGQETPADFKQNLRWLRDQLPPTLPIFFLNGAEIEVPGSSETGAKARHQQMNQALAEFVVEADNCYLIDVRDFVREPTDVTNNLRHYQRAHYRTLAQRLATALSEWQGRKLARSGWRDLKARLLSRLPW
ncbi:hypothetical protein F1C16_04830 [Hymenobacter sp. NBH84]|uniref:hypothetical protein n=1 Tax=Hymenobacter sp. NBH84 TaxID=2596915 RepID=UPI001623B40F|nr:hypothetical protein [Hymenobacter sp. NBH84]QNE38929.1 hypothetical protein F1C16_04830 [Hymenobacter sp. NBH84]